MRTILFILILFFTLNSFAQTNVDSLWAIWNNKSIEDTSRYTALNSLISKHYISENPDTAIVLSKLMLKETTSNSPYHTLQAHNNLAISSFSIVGSKELSKILQNFESFAYEIKPKDLRAKAHYFLALRYLRFGDYPKSSEHFYESLRLFETLKDTLNMARSNQNIGQLYYYQKDYDSALDFYTKSQKMFELVNNTRGLAMSYNNLGRLFKKQEKIDEALASFEKSKLLLESINDNKSIVQILGNMSLIYKRLSNYDKALSMTDEIITYAEKSKDNSTLITALSNKASINNKLNNTTIALKSATRAYKLSEGANLPKKSMMTSVILFNIYKKQGNYQKALEFYENYIAIKEELLNEENKRGLIRKEYEFEYDKKMLADSIKDAEAKKVLDAQIATQKAKLKQEKTQKIALYGGLVVLALFGGFVYNRFRLAKKQKAIIEKQKKEVEIAHEELEEVHKEITDSINYAERIQRSFLATEEILNNNLNEHFVFFQPKEAVSGDFYWATKLSNGNFAIVNADSTGHGVPGAIMSILNISSLEKAVEKGLTNPSDIFNDTRKTIIERLKKDGSAEGGKDGMDASIVCYDFTNNKIIYTAANNPIWVIRDKKVIQFKPEKMPVGKHDNDKTPFTHSEFEIKKGDQIYTLTDGFQDQFGGPKGKKYMVKRMREFVLSVSHLPMEEQHHKIKAEFNNWRQDVEQIDDVCVIGVRI